MKKFILSFLAVIGIYSATAQNLSPYIKIGTTDKTISETATEIKGALQREGFDILGSYNPEDSQNLMVIVFSSKDLQHTVLQVNDRGALAAALKIGLKSDGAKTTITSINPHYLFNAYLRGEYSKHEASLEKVVVKLRSALTPFNQENKPFGGSLSAKELQNYHYKMMMPYFTDPVTLKKFNSFEEGVNTIKKNLAAKKGKTKLVYELKFTDDKIAVFGVGLLDKEKGEAAFLPIIGEDHIAAMPYEIILQDNVATMLHGRYRIALHWPELTMGTFMKIMSTPGNIEDTLKELCE
jgi:uncharacterized protein (DUF302 family)